MAHGKETPRQKMIGMMYLVLTALLALNVSKSVLDAFVLVDKGLGKTIENFTAKNDITYAAFDAKDAENHAKVGKWKAKADSVKAEANTLIDHIQALKLEIVMKADGPEGNLEHIQSKDDTNIPGEIMVVNGKGDELKNKIDALRDFLKTYVKPESTGLLESIDNNLDTSDPPENEGGEKESWVQYNFEHLPLIAVITLMSKMQADIRNAEADMLAYLYKEIDIGSFKFNKLEAIVLPESNYVLVGNPYKAKVFIAASDTTVAPEIIVGGRHLPVKDGKGEYSGSTSSPGIKTWGGLIKMIHPATKDTLTYKFKSEYQVAEASLVVSPTKMNVFYVGVPNPVDISVPGVAGDKINASLSGAGNIRKKSGNSYTVRVKKPNKDVYVSVSANVGGNLRNMGRKKFRVKAIPDPIAMVGKNKGGTYKKSLLLAQSGVKAELEDFLFDLKFKVTRFTVSAVVRGFTEEKHAKSASFTQAQKGLIRMLKPGQKVYIENIYARGPDGKDKKLPTIMFRLK